jgi:hypothetical protein
VPPEKKELPSLAPPLVQALDKMKANPVLFFKRWMPLDGCAKAQLSVSHPEVTMTPVASLADGTCLFSSVSYALTGRYIYSSLLRLAVFLALKEAKQDVVRELYEQRNLQAIVSDVGQESERQLIQDAQEGDLEAWERLFDLEQQRGKRRTAEVGLLYLRGISLALSRPVVCHMGGSGERTISFHGGQGLPLHLYWGKVELVRTPALPLSHRPPLLKLALFSLRATILLGVCNIDRAGGQVHPRKAVACERGPQPFRSPSPRSPSGHVPLHCGRMHRGVLEKRA